MPQSKNRCSVCRSVWTDDIHVCPNDGVPLDLDRAAQRLFADPQAYYYGGSGNVDWMESTLAALARVLEVSPSHCAAIELKREIEERLPKCAGQAQERIDLAADKLSSGDFAGCIDVLDRNRGTLRQKQATELWQRIRQKIRDGTIDPNHKDAQRLAARLFDDVYGRCLEEPGGLWGESIAEALAEVLRLWPNYEPAIRLKKGLKANTSCRSAG